jgi:DNA polymerase (family 10)
METGLVTIFAHPSGRLLGEREPYDLDYEAIFKTAKKTNTFLEINAYPKRLDLTDINCRVAAGYDVGISINTDAHTLNQMNFMRLGVAVARRGWLSKENILNSLPLRDLFNKIGKH